MQTVNRFISFFCSFLECLKHGWFRLAQKAIGHLWTNQMI
uniref:Uncharacterized protein n=1 Tax=Anguilla anguilla TaxID=7936 RepID=A0A0E9X9W5_ANGAN